MRGAARPDELVVDQVGRHADEGEIAPPLPDDLVARREGDQVGEAFECDGVAVADQPRHRLRQRHDLRHEGKASGRRRTPHPPECKGSPSRAIRPPRCQAWPRGFRRTHHHVHHRRSPRAPARLRHHAAHRARRVGAARRSGGRGGGAAARRGAGRRAVRHRRLLRPLRRRGAPPRGAAPLRRPDRRDQGGLPAHGPAQWVACGRPEYLRQQCEMSLRRLDVERIDLFQLHRVDAGVPADEQFGLLAELQSEGKVGAVGLSEVYGRPDRAGARRSSTSRPCRTATTSSTAPATTCCATAPSRASASSPGSRSRPGGSPSRVGRWRRRPSGSASPRPPSRWRGCCSGRR